MQNTFEWYLKSEIGPPPSLYFPDAFSNDEVNKIVLLGDNLPKEEAQIGPGGKPPTKNNEVRKTTLSFIPVTKDSEWLFRKLTDIINQANDEHFNFNISRIQTLQYSIYNTGDFYDVHIDTHTNSFNGMRKISFSLQLTDEEEYTGGDLVLIPGIPGAKSGPFRKKGTIILFNSMLGHEVTTVTSGTRKALVGWVTGPSFK